MRLFVHRADRFPVFLLFLMLCADFAVYAFVQSPWVIIPYFFLMIFPKAAACSFNHHHQHVPIFAYAWANRLVEIMFALQTGVSTYAWTLHHSLGHHLNYLDQTKDESRWTRADGTPMGEFEYSLDVTLTAYPRAWKVGAKYPELRRTFLLMGIFMVALITTLVWLKPVAGFFLFVVGPIVSLFGTAWATFDHHAGRSTDSHFVACNNIRQRFYNWLTCNLGYHTAHHYRPGVHWSKLPELHAQIEANIPAESFHAPGYPWRWFGDPLLPKTATNDVQAPSGGQVTEAA